MINIIDRQSLIYLNEFNLKWNRRFLYGYDGGEDGFYKWLDTKQQEFESSNKHWRIPLKNSNKMAKRTRNSTLLSKQKGGDIAQDEAMHIPSGATFTITLSEPWDKARQDWHSFCSSNKS